MKEFNDIIKNHPQMEVTDRLLKVKAFRPKYSIKIGNNTFFTSPIIIGNERGQDQMVMFVKKGKSNRLFPRALYKSRSDGTWRSCPGCDRSIHTYKKKPKGNHHCKGQKIHYTQETRPCLELLRHIDSLYKEPKTDYEKDVNLEYFDFSDDWNAEWLTFEREWKRYDDKGKLKEIQKYAPGRFYDKYFPRKINFSKKFREFKYPKGFLPDFSKEPEDTFTTTHSYHGKTVLRTYPAKLNGRPIRWVMAHAKDKVWVFKIEPMDAKVNTYGTLDEVIDSGCLTHKTLDYWFQNTSLTEGRDYKEFRKGHKHVDITPLLNNLKPIREFKKSRGIE